MPQAVFQQATIDTVLLEQVDLLGQCHLLAHPRGIFAGSLKFITGLQLLVGSIQPLVGTVEGIDIPVVDHVGGDAHDVTSRKRAVYRKWFWPC